MVSEYFRSRTAHIDVYRHKPMLQLCGLGRQNIRIRPEKLQNDRLFLRPFFQKFLGVFIMIGQCLRTDHLGIDSTGSMLPAYLPEAGVGYAGHRCGQHIILQNQGPDFHSFPPRDPFFSAISCSPFRVSSRS